MAKRDIATDAEDVVVHDRLFTKALVLDDSATTITAEVQGINIGDCVLISAPQWQQIYEKKAHEIIGRLYD